jgi:hypothetical protein
MDHEKPTIHDGERVRLELLSKEITHTAFGRGMKWEISKVSRMLTQESWKTDDLARAGTILGCNFFLEYQIISPVTHQVGKVTATLVLSLDLGMNREAYETANKQLRSVMDSIRPADDPPEK